MRTVKQRIALATLIYISKTSLRHGQLHRKMQIGLVIERYGKTHKTPMIKKLIASYGVEYE